MTAAHLARRKTPQSAEARLQLQIGFDNLSVNRVIRCFFRDRWALLPIINPLEHQLHLASMADDLIIGMAGSGGDGIVSAGESLISAAAES